MRPRLLAFCCLVSLLSLPAVAFQADVPPDRGYIRGGEYHSVFFAFRCKVPEGWTASTVAPDDTDSAREIAKDEASAKAMQDAGKSNMYLVTLTRGGESIRFASQDLYFTGLKSPEAYLDSVEQAVKTMSAMKMERLGEKIRELEGRRLVTRTYKTMVNDGVFYQSMTSMFERKYQLLVVGTFLKPEGLESLDPVKLLTFEPRAAAPAVAEKPAKPGPQYGEIEGSKYTNPFFGLTLAVSDTWEIQEQEAVRRLRAASERGVKPDEAEAHEASMQRTHFLLTAVPKARGAMLMAFAEDIQMIDLESADQYLRIMAKTMNTELKSGPGEVTIGGKKFSRGLIEQVAAGQTITHSVYVTIERDFALVFDVLAADPALLAEGKKIVESMTFKAPEKPNP